MHGYNIGDDEELVKLGDLGLISRFERSKKGQI